MQGLTGRAKALDLDGKLVIGVVMTFEDGVYMTTYNNESARDIVPVNPDTIQYETTTEFNGEIIFTGDEVVIDKDGEEELLGTIKYSLGEIMLTLTDDTDISLGRVLYTLPGTRIKRKLIV